MKLTVAEIAQKYGVSSTSVYKQIKSGKIHADAVGGLYLVSPEDIPEHWKRGWKGRWQAEKMAGRCDKDEF